MERRLDNLGEEDQFYVKNHHEPIVSEEVFEQAQDILHRRGENCCRGEKGKRAISFLIILVSYNS
ncbi:recombinase family protein [Brevibacillus fluminis]|uniref:recombinase family protein n=1 Tax=Brevibacillus fluminis TaxID=511487 RepID=UPI003F8A7E7A